MNATITINSNNDSNWENAPDTGDLKWSGGSWKDYWIKYSGVEWPSYCCRDSCFNEATDGAHLIRLNSDVMYIAPFCHDHNPRTVEYPKINPRFSLKCGSLLVNADDKMMDAKDTMERGKNKANEILDTLKGYKVSDL